MASKPQGKLAADFGKFLRQRRTALDISLRQLAAQYGIAQGYLSDLENGKINPRRISAEVLFDISKGYKIRLTAILKRLKLLPED